MPAIIVTGAGRGIGRATAEAFLEAGWQVRLIGRMPDPLHDLADAHSRALPLPCDVTDEDAVEAAFGIACGQIDIGNALTDMPEKMTDGIPQADGAIRSEPVMEARHVAASVLHMASVPLDANVLFTTVMATVMPYIGRG